VPVTDANVAEMRQLVINGPVWPGASMVELEDGSLITLVTLPMSLDFECLNNYTCGRLRP
jgi:hypothetical protein